MRHGSSRGAEVLVSLLGAVFRGILCNDRRVVYLTVAAVSGCGSTKLSIFVSFRSGFSDPNLRSDLCTFHPHGCTLVCRDAFTAPINDV